MKSVYILGTGATSVAEHWDRTAVSLGREALRAALAASGNISIGAVYVANALGSVLGVQAQLGPALATATGLTGLEAISVSAGGASGGVALRQAYQAVAAGVYDAVAVVGVEKVSDVLDGAREAALALDGDVDWEAIQGTTQTAQWAMLMRRYMHQYSVGANAFAAFPVNAHANGAANRQAMYRFAITPDKVVAAAMVADPIGLLDTSTLGDGAAAVIVANERVAREMQGTLVRIAGTSVATDTLALHSRRDPLALEAAKRSASGALKMAALNHSDVQVIDVTDPHGISAVLALEASGFVEAGMATAMANEGAIRPDGALPLATGGGCKARGDIVGATGVYQIVELIRQLRGEAGTTQVAGAQVAFAQCLGGIGSTVATHVLVRDE